ncbi:site-specific integrase [Streptomyces sp. NPDC000594]|uniref:site-specific integrase n=1 Tax=Streptomyces sp. NPDC000594 TaxID=3154261 RepID=UPI00331DB55F
MRHTCASWLVQRGVSPYEVQHLLGHESFQTTQRSPTSSPMPTRPFSEPGRGLRPRSPSPRRAQNVNRPLLPIPDGKKGPVRCPPIAAGAPAGDVPECRCQRSVTEIRWSARRQTMINERHFSVKISPVTPTTRTTRIGKTPGQASFFTGSRIATHSTWCVIGKRSNARSFRGRYPASAK